MRRLLLLLGFIVTSLAAQISFAAESIQDQHIQIQLLAPLSFAANSETVVGLRFQPDPHWHVYWKNPGDSGAAPKFTFTAQNAEVGPILWPYPTRMPVAHLTNLGYDGETAYLFKVKTSNAESLEVSIALEWLVCQEECVPGFGEIKFTRPIVGSLSIYPEAIKKKLEFYEARTSLPGRDSPFNLEIKTPADGSFRVFVKSKETLPEQIDLFPADPEYVLPAQPQVEKHSDSVEFIFQKSNVAKAPDKFEFLLVADGKAYEFTGLSLGPKPTATTTATESASIGLLAVLLGSALLGGILLNLMPCVFPVISIKAVSLLKNTDHRARKKDGVLYTAGVLTTFAALGAAFLILRQLGSAVGWGFQLQSPVIVFALIVLFWLMALNFIGVFDFGTKIMNTSGQLNWHSSFGAGILSVFIAAPCTGPFMGTALGATATLPSAQAMLVFVFLGLGLALPYLAITFSDSLARKMPKPGAWMETLKEILAFPLFATVLWLLWVLGQQAGTQGWFYSAAALLGISFALWLGQRKRAVWKVIAWIFAIAMIVHAGQKIQTAEVDPSSQQQSEWTAYSDEKLQAALLENHAVFVDFTAAWCITCQVNKKAVLETDAAVEIFKTKNILRMRADWTKQDPHITQALARLGRNSVPVYVFYAGNNSEPQILPQILTLDMIRNLIPLKEEK
jgi:Thiol:disulfide interchange protein